MVHKSLRSSRYISSASGRDRRSRFGRCGRTGPGWGDLHRVRDSASRAIRILLDRVRDDRAARCRLRSPRGNPRGQDRGGAPRGAPLGRRASLGAVEARRKRAVKKAKLLPSATTSIPCKRDGASRGRRSGRTNAEGASPVHVRLRAVESTSAVEQPSSFAGWRSVGSLGRCGSKADESLGSRTTDTPGRHFSSASDSAAMTRGARREKRRGLHHVVCRGIEPASPPAPKTKRESAPSGT
jgi:hypothetical protein